MTSIFERLTLYQTGLLGGWSFREAAEDTGAAFGVA